uniref:(California timema) hypothetical protein n=1 Tax=Timema californicum TaxID=61474 RepID=A0A7R9P4Q7_TIMCA|nr:unnamed protein product [Timema californicum]
MSCTFSSADQVYKEAVDAFLEEFGVAPEAAACAPGRVNLIGEHTDYNEGFVLPMALPMVTVVVGKKNGSEICRVVTTCEAVDAPLKAEFFAPIKEPPKPGTPKWANYVKGVAANFKGKIPGFDAIIASSVPIGGGLSSSAALEVAFYIFLEALTGHKTGKETDKALACQKAEHDFAGMPCGIMDQFIAVLAKQGNALLIDCRSLDYTLVPLNDPDIMILIINSNIKHELTGSEYPSRRRQCEMGATALGKNSLREATVQDVDVLRAKHVEEEVIKRVRHVTGEIERTKRGADALKDGDYKAFGKLMVESHNSLKVEYEVSCPELDQLVEVTLAAPGVLGSRMTGAGFGGCTVTLLNKDSAGKAIEDISKGYKGTASFYIVTASDGAREIPVKK